MLGLFALATLALWATAGITLAWRSAHLVRPQEHGVVERLGRYHATLEPGLHLLIPFVDRMTRVQGGQRTLRVERRSYLYQPMSLVSLEATLTFDVIQATRAHYGVAELEHALATTAQAFTSDALAQLHTPYVPAHAFFVSDRVRRKFSELEEAWGVRVVAYDVTEAGRAGRAGPRALDKGSASDVVSVGGASTPVAISSD